MRFCDLLSHATLASDPVLAAQIAATVEYEPAKAPAEPSMPAGARVTRPMQAAPGSTLSYLNIKAIDGFHVQSALWKPRRYGGRRTGVPRARFLSRMDIPVLSVAGLIG